MNHAMAIIEREMRKFFRSPALMMASMIMPLVQLIVLGNAFGGKIRDAKMGLVDEDHGTQAVRIEEAFDAVRANVRTFIPIPYDNEVQAREDVRNGKIQGAVIIPAQYSKMVYEKNHPRIALIVDNSDNFMSATFEDEMTQVDQRVESAGRFAAAVAADGAGGGGALSLYRVHEIPAAGIDYAGDVCLGDDRRRDAVYRRQGARIHEGYLVTPITKTELVLGLVGAGAIKAVMTGVVITVVGSLLAGVGTIFNPGTMLGLWC